MAGADVSPFNSILARFEGLVDRLETVAGGPGVSKGAASTPSEPAIAAAFDALTAQHLAPLEAAAKNTGVKDIVEGTEIIIKTFGMVRGLLVSTSKCKKPADADWSKFLGPVMELGKSANQACDNRSDYFQNRKAVAEAVNLAMFVPSSAPPAHVKNVLESMDFHAIKVMQKKIDTETAWIKGLKAAIQALQEWCVENCKLGVVWNAGGQDAVDYFAAQPLGDSAAPPAKAAKGKGKGPPPPKAAPSAEMQAKMKAAAEGQKAAAGGPSMAEVFAGISQFNTGSLRKVTDDMKTKNRPKGDGYPAPAPKKPTPAPAPAAAKGRDAKGPRGPPRLELEKDRNWMVENYSGVNDLKISEATIGHLVVIINCKNVTVQITSQKVKSICIDGCEKVNVICNDVLSCVELVNSDKVQVQANGKANSFAIDKCSGVNIYLSKESIDAEITSSKSSEMNLTIPQGEDDSIELPIPEQFVTKVAGKKLKTEVSSLYS